MFGILKQNKKNANPETKVIQPSISTSGSFSMTVQDVFFITGRGVVATGTIENGDILILSMTDDNDSSETINAKFSFIVTGDKLVLTNQSGDVLSYLFGVGEPMEFTKA